MELGGDHAPSHYKLELVLIVTQKTAVAPDLLTVFCTGKWYVPPYVLPVLYQPVRESTLQCLTVAIAWYGGLYALSVSPLSPDIPQGNQPRSSIMLLFYGSTRSNVLDCLAF